MHELVSDSVLSGIYVGNQPDVAKCNFEDTIIGLLHCGFGTIASEFVGNSVLISTGMRYPEYAHFWVKYVDKEIVLDVVRTLRRK